ncbi:MAG: NADP-dependent oxidoreductase [Candidatus Baltobacteraceae bacterium]
MNTQIVLASRPIGEPTLNDFRTVSTAIPKPAAGEVLLATKFLSLDPYMRGRMSATKSYAEPVALGGVMVGQTVSEVLESADPTYRTGEIVLSANGWQTHAVAPGKTLRKLDAEIAPVSYALGILGTPGKTAYCALLDIGRPKPGETVVVSAASGAVGSVAGQIAKIKGCRVVGIAGSDEKCTYVTDVLGFDQCINRRKADLPKALAQVCPNGIDVYFDNTAGTILTAVLGLINVGARIPLVGLIEHYNATALPAGPYLGPLLTNRAKIEGFLVSDHSAHSAAFARDVAGWMRDGKLHYKEDVLDGLDKAPQGLIGMLRGENFGKLIVRVS